MGVDLGHGRTASLHVQSVPAGHPFVQALGGPGVTLLPDPPVPGADPGQWWPHPALEADWIDGHADAFDLLHIHFGTESRTTAQLRDLLDALTRRARPLVVTVHDLEHPQLVDPAGHEEQLGVLVRGADAVLTLTPGAAREIDRRFGVAATVVPHPQLATDDWFVRADGARSARDRAGPAIGVHLRALRPNVRGGALLGPLAEAAGLAGATLHVFVNDEPRRSPEAAAALAEAEAALLGRPGVRWHRRSRPDDEMLARELAALDVSVLPYVHGTHSGWLELCWDLGVRVLAPPVGFFAEQHPDPWFLRQFQDVGAIAEALDLLLDAGRIPAASERLAMRRDELPRSQRLQRAVYEDVLRSMTGAPAGPAA